MILVNPACTVTGKQARASRAAISSEDHNQPQLLWCLSEGRMLYRLYRNTMLTLYRSGIQCLQTWYTGYTDLVYRLYRHGIQCLQTWYTGFTACQDTGYTAFLQLSHASLRGCASQRKTTHNNPCHPPRTTTLRRSSAAPSETVLGHAWPPRRISSGQDTGRLTLFTLPVPNQQCHHRINSRLRSGFF